VKGRLLSFDRNAGIVVGSLCQSLAISLGRAAAPVARFPRVFSSKDGFDASTIDAGLSRSPAANGRNRGVPGSVLEAAVFRFAGRNFPPARPFPLQPFPCPAGKAWFCRPARFCRDGSSGHGACHLKSFK